MKIDFEITIKFNAMINKIETNVVENRFKKILEKKVMNTVLICQTVKSIVT
jgi:hypothetical protein